MKKIYVGNLSWDTSESELRSLFEATGTVHSASIVMDRESGRSRGFGFVEMGDGDADRAIAKLNRSEIGGRSLNVSEARDRNDSSPRPGSRTARSF